jgi:hypothetical protein
VPYLANIDGLIWLVIIVVSIIIQVVKAVRKASSQAPMTASPRSAPAERRAPARATGQKQASRIRSDELRQFFETLGIPVQEMAPVAKSKQRKQPKTPKAAPALPILPRKHEPAQPTATVKLESLVQELPPQTRGLLELLKKPDTQRQAVLLREILGPPLALR